MTTHHDKYTEHDRTHMTEHDYYRYDQYDDHGLMTTIITTIGTIATTTSPTFANQRISATQLRWHGHTYLAPFGTNPPADDDDEPSNDWLRVEPD